MISAWWLIPIIIFCLFVGGTIVVISNIFLAEKLIFREFAHLEYFYKRFKKESWKSLFSIFYTFGLLILFLICLIANSGHSD